HNYQSMTQTFHLTPKESVDTAIKAKKMDINLNKAVEATRDLHDHLPAAERPEFEGHVKRFLPHLDEQNERDIFNNHLKDIDQRHPDLKPKTDELRKQYKLKEEQLDNALHNANTNEATVRRKDAGVTDDLALLNAPTSDQKKSGSGTTQPAPMQKEA